MRTKTLAVLSITLIALTGCASTAEPEPSAPPTSTTPERTQVDWDALPPNYQRIVDEETADGDCDALQDMFDAAPTDVDLLNYLDEALELAGCY